MTSFKNITANKNFLSPLGFKFVMTRMPNVEYYCQSVSLPEMRLGTTTMPNPFVRIPVAGDQLTFGNLSLTFKVDEDMTNYRELYDWMISLGFPDNYKQYANLADQPIVSDKGVRSDASLLILTSAKHPHHEIKFYEMFPTSLSGMKFDSTLPDVQYIEASVEFVYRKFELKTII